MRNIVMSNLTDFSNSVILFQKNPVNLHFFKASILIRPCSSAPLLFLGLGALLKLLTYRLVWSLL